MNKYQNTLGRPRNRDNAHNGTINGKRGQERARSEAAAERQAERLERGDMGQLARLDEGHYTAVAERKRISARL